MKTLSLVIPGYSKHGYSEHAYSEFMLTAQIIPFLLSLNSILNLLNI